MTQYINNTFCFNKAYKFTAILAISCAAISSAYGQVDDAFTENTSAVETAVESTYNQLLDFGCTTDDGDDVSELTTFETTDQSCTGDILSVFRITRTLVNTASDLDDPSGEGGFSRFGLGTDQLGYEQALRWNAAEELASQDSISSKFSNNQLASVSARISSLRAGSLGFNIEQIYNPNKVANHAKNYSTPNHSTPNYGTGLNAGDNIAWSKLGGFLNGSYTYGNLGATANEDAFDFDGIEINAGLDYRLNNQWVFGGILGLVDQRVDFDPLLSTVEGSIEMAGLSLTPFVLYQADKWYATASLNYLINDFTNRRVITYTSFNSNVPNTDTEAVSKNKAHAFTFNTASGYSFQLNDRLSLEPSFALNYQKLTVDEFDEEDINDTAYNLRIFEQTIHSFETITSIKLQYVTSNKLGVFTPFIDIKSFAQHHTDKRFIRSVYAAVADFVTSDAHFVLATNAIDADYKSIGIGVASVLRGARQSSFDSAAAGGIQAFISLRMLADLGEFEQKTLTAGVRYEF